MSTHIRKFFSYAVRLPRHTLLGRPSAGRLATAPARPSARSPASASTGRFHRSNLLGQKARGPLRPRILYRGREQSRADPRPAWVRVSLQSSNLSGASTRGRRYALRPVTSTHVRKFFHAMRLPRCSALRISPAGALLPRPPGLQTDHPRPPSQAAFTVPIYTGRKRGARCDLNASTEVETEAERTRGPPGFASRCKSSDLSGASTCGRYYASCPVTSTPL